MQWLKLLQQIYRQVICFIKLYNDNRYILYSNPTGFQYIYQQWHYIQNDKLIIKSILQDILHFSDLKILLSTKSKSEDLVNACNKPFFVEGYKFHRLRNEFFMPQRKNIVGSNFLCIDRSSQINEVHKNSVRKQRKSGQR